MAPFVQPPRHGTYTRYRKGCHCEGCRAANRERTRKQRQARADQGKLPGTGRHGARAYTNYQCRCGVCRAAALAAWSARGEELQAQSREQARNNGKKWTGPEVEIAVRSDLTLLEAAQLSGRTLRAVHQMRYLVARNDPHAMALLGGSHR